MQLGVEASRRTDGVGRDGVGVHIRIGDERQERLVAHLDVLSVECTVCPRQAHLLDVPQFASRWPAANCPQLGMKRSKFVSSSSERVMPPKAHSRSRLCPYAPETTSPAPLNSTNW